MQSVHENTKAGTVDYSLEFTVQMLDALERAAKHPSMIEDPADVLSTPQAHVVREVQSGSKSESSETCLPSAFQPL